MKQILQSLKNGVTEVVDVPCPALGRGQVLIRTVRTLVSAGTERTLVDFGKAGLIGKARQQPEKVRQAVDKIRTDGLLPTLEAVFNKLDQPLPLGYCNVGIVLEVGEGVTEFAPGDRVVSNGRHAEVVVVPVNLCARVSDELTNDEAAFTVLGAVALQGIRLVQPTLGEAVVVMGLGLVGLMTVQLLRSHGCRVLAVDFEPGRLALAERFGAETVNLAVGRDPISAAQAFSRGHGVDAVIVTASTRSSEPIHQAALMSRKRGRIVLVGVTGLELSRADFYEKELTFQVSCSYGPGRYDPNYEEKGYDYPVGFVRWTEQRNFEAVLDVMAAGGLDVKPLISHRFSVAEAEGAYELITGKEQSLGILLDYPGTDARPATALTQRTVELATPSYTSGRATVGFIGAGNYATTVLIPAFKKSGAVLMNVASQAGVTGFHAGRKFGFKKTTTDISTILDDPATSIVVVATRHDSHADLTSRAQLAGKHVFVEKPLALSREELSRILAAHEEAATASFVAPLLMVGFNRRFAPHAKKIKELLKSVSGPKVFVMTVNAGAIAGNHWVQDQQIGGGRLIGEACHFIDLLRFLVGAPITAHHAMRMASSTTDTATLSLAFADGSIGTVHYIANGARSFPKERLEVFCGGRVLRLDNFRRLIGFGWPKFGQMNLWRQDKGQNACVDAFVRAVEQGGPPPIPFDELMEVTRVTIELADTASR